MVSSKFLGMQIIIVVLCCLLSLNSFCECYHLRKQRTTIKEKKATSNDTTNGDDNNNNNNNDNNDDDSKHSDDLVGESRIAGGIREKNVPPYLGTLWSARHDNNNTDGRFVGTGIGMGGNHMIVHQKSLDAIKESAPLGVSFFGIEGPPSANQPASYQFPGEKNFHVLDGGPKVEMGGGTLKTIRDDQILKGGFRLLTAHQDWASQPKPSFAAPVLEHDKSNFGKNCKGYGWSHHPTGGESRRSKGREIVSFHVSAPLKPCNDGHCTLSTYDLPSCDSLGDHGMPVLCGKEQKLTYLLKPKRDDIDCKFEMDAFHVPHLIDELKTIRSPGFKLAEPPTPKPEIDPYIN